MAERKRQAVLVIAPMGGTVTGQAEVSRAVEAALSRVGRVLSVNTNFENWGALKRAMAQIGVLAQIISKSGRYEWAYLSFKRGRLSVIFDYLALRLIRATRPRLIVGHLHGNEMFCGDRVGWAHRIFARNLALCDRVICLNSYQQEQLASIFQVHNSSVLPNFSNLRLSQSELETRLAAYRQRDILNVMYFSNLLIKKGIMDFLDVATMAGPGIGFTVFGKLLNEGSSDANAISARLADMPINCRYAGPVYGADRREAWAQVDVILFPSTYSTEAQPLVLIEAMSMGIIPIVYDRAYASDLIPPEGGPGVRIAERALEDIVALLQALRNDPERVEEMRRAAWDSAKKFSRDEFERALISLTLTVA
ncbi:MAG: glycosyltransferase family 4 protein [Gammaproteobacteria bacterium]|nr:glycosyltransferase family 4 protein [Gammaproteobacteria bacterium]